MSQTLEEDPWGPQEEQQQQRQQQAELEQPPGLVDGVDGAHGGGRVPASFVNVLDWPFFPLMPLLQGLPICLYCDTAACFVWICLKNWGLSISKISTDAVFSNLHFRLADSWFYTANLLNIAIWGITKREMLQFGTFSYTICGQNFAIPAIVFKMLT